MKLKKLISLFLAVVSIITLVSCNNHQYVNFYNYDGTLLWQTPYSKDMILTYEGETPTKEKDNIYEYTFSGWNHSLYEVSTYRNFYAQYNKEFRSFNVTFCNYDNSIISTVRATYGTSVVDKAPENPSKPNSLREHYYFSGWGDVDLSYITQDITVVAQFSNIECFKIEYKDYDDSLLNTEYIEKGSSSDYTINKYRVADDDHYYVFSNWSDSVSNVQCDMIVKAIYKTVNACTVTFKNYDGSVLGTDKGPEGFDAKYDGSTPTKSSYTSGYYTYSYRFSGWDISLNNIRSNKTATAQYYESSTYYNPDYESALNKIRTNAKSDSFDYETGRYYKGFDAYVSSTKLIAGYGEVDGTTDTVDLYYAFSTYQNGYWAGGSVTIFFNSKKPGTYNVFYSYVMGGVAVAFGYFDIYSGFNSSSSILFTQITNLSSASDSAHADMASSLIKTCLTSAKSCSWIDTKNLGFDNY